MPSLGTQDVATAFAGAIEHLGLSAPLAQRDVKSAVTVAVDRLCGSLRAKGSREKLRVFANRSKRFLGEGARDLRFTTLVPHESMVDVAVFRGVADPYETVITAESEAYSQHLLPDDGGTEHSDYLWDLFKLLQVPSPLRIFVARINAPRRELLETMVAETVKAYSQALRDGDRLFSVVLPTSQKAYVEVTCQGWEVRGGNLVDLEPASLLP